MKRLFLVVCLLISLLLLSAATMIGCQEKRPTPTGRKKVSKPASTTETGVLTEIPNVQSLRVALKPGDTTQDFALKTPDGVEKSLFQLLKDKPVMLEFGSYT